MKSEIRKLLKYIIILEYHHQRQQQQQLVGVGRRQVGRSVVKDEGVEVARQAGRPGSRSLQRCNERRRPNFEQTATTTRTNGRTNERTNERTTVFFVRPALLTLAGNDITVSNWTYIPIYRNTQIQSEWIAGYCRNTEYGYIRHTPRQQQWACMAWNELVLGIMKPMILTVWLRSLIKGKIRCVGYDFSMRTSTNNFSIFEGVFESIGKKAMQLQSIVI